MNNKDSNSNDEYNAGIKLIISAIRMDEALSEMLKIQVWQMKKSLKSGVSVYDFARLNTFLKNTITAIILTSEKIESGIDLLKTEKQNPKG